MSGFALAIISDITTTSMFLTAFFVGYVTNVWIGLAVFFGTHTLIKMVNAVNGAIITNGRHSLQAGRTLASVFASQAHEPPSTPPETSSEG